MESKPSNPKDRAAVTKLDLSLLSEVGIAYGNLAMAEGDYKYGAYNYRAVGVKASVYIAALKRHLAKYENGEWADKKTHVPHLGSIIACAAILADGHAMGNLVDDRPYALDMEEIYNECEKINKHLQQLFPNHPGRFIELNRKEKSHELPTDHRVDAGPGPGCGPLPAPRVSFK